MSRLIPLAITDDNSVVSDLRGGSVAIGNFDGAHRGHAHLIAALTQQAQKVGGPAIVITFDPPPIALLKPDRKLGNPLTTLERRSELLGKLGVDAVVVLRTTTELLSLSPEAFFYQTIVEALAARAMAEGPNFRFGAQRRGDTKMLAELCRDSGITLQIVEGQTRGDQLISSTRIRQLITAGNVAAAGAMLTAPYEISGQVTTGAKRGRDLGFPTANLADIPVLLPANGVYAGTTEIDDQSYRVAVNIGSNPTFDDASTKVEAHVLDWDGDLYGRHLKVCLHERIRDVKRFDSLGDLKRQIAADIQRCRSQSQ
ncbi:MAG: bifunctional riboflavin kinase/FAD synthetase [Aureliella sp.]